MNKAGKIEKAYPIEKLIILVRNQKVLLDSDIANLYDVETKVLTRAVKRNIERFPKDFMFQLTKPEFDALRCQIGTSKTKGGRRYLPYVFTEQGVAMLSGVLRSSKAITVNIEIMRAFVNLRKLLNEDLMLSEKLNKLERKYDEQFQHVFSAIKQLMEVPVKTKKNQIGFIWDKEDN